MKFFSLLFMKYSCNDTRRAGPPTVKWDNHRTSVLKKHILFSSKTFIPISSPLYTLLFVLFISNKLFFIVGRKCVRHDLIKNTCNHPHSLANRINNFPKKKRRLWNPNFDENFGVTNIAATSNKSIFLLKTRKKYI